MAPKLGDIRQIEELSASEVPSVEGAWWIMLQTAESICNCAYRRDPVNNSYLSEFWNEAAPYVEEYISEDGDHPLPYDDLMQMITFCGDQLQSVVRNPRHNLVKVDRMVRPQKVRDITYKTINWLGKQPGKTVREKMAGKQSLLTQKKEYSFDIKENQVAMALYKQLMRRVSDRVNHGVKVGAYDESESKQINQMLRIKKILKESPLGEVNSKNVTQANNALLSDKNYSVIWRAYLDMARYDTRFEKQWQSALEMYVKSVFLALNAELLAYEDIYVIENRVLFEDAKKLKASYVMGYSYRIPYIIDIVFSGKSISISIYDSPLYGSGISNYRKEIECSFSDKVSKEYLVAHKGTPISVDFVEDGESKKNIYTADLSCIREVVDCCIKILFEFSGVEALRIQKDDFERKYSNASVAFDIVSNGLKLGLADEDINVVDRFYSDRAVVYNNSNTVYPGGLNQVHLNAESEIAIRDAVISEDARGLKAVLDEIHNLISLSPEDYFFYLVPDALEELRQKDLKQCVKSCFTRTFPVWRSVSALTYWLEREEYNFSPDDVFGYIDLVGDTATAGILTVHEDKAIDTLVCNHFPPFPQIDEGDDITEDAFCRLYVNAFAEKYGFDIPEDVVESLITSNSIKLMLIKDAYANQYLWEKKIASVYQITYDEELLNACMDEWLKRISVFWKKMHKRFDDTKRISNSIFLSDVLIDVLYQLKREEDLYSVFDRVTAQNIRIFQSSSDSILRGTLSYKHRLNNMLPTWTEYLPELSLEVIKNGNYAQLELIGKDVAFDVMGEDNEHAVDEQLVLKAGQKEYRFPLKKMDISRKASLIDAYITDKSFPLDYDLGVKLAVRYKYGFDNSFELILSTEVEKDAPFESIIVDWKEGIKKEKKSLYPVYPELTNYDKTLKDIEGVKYRLQGVLNTIERFFVNYSSYNAHKCNLSKLGADLTKPIFTIRNIIVHSEIQEANEFVEWFYQSRIFILCCEIAQIFRNDNIPDIFFDEFGDDQKYQNLICSAMQLIYSFGQRTPKQLQDYLLKHYYKMSVPHKDNILLNMLYLNSDNDAIMEIVLDESTDHNKMDACIKEISSLCWFDSKMIYKLKEYPAFVKAILQYITSDLEAKRDDAEKGKEYEDFKMKSQRKRYLRYIEMILAILRLREDPDFDLLVVASREANALAETIRMVDDYMGNPNSKIKLKVNKPQALCNMSDIAFAIDMYLTGDEGVDLIEVVSVDMD